MQLGAAAQVVVLLLLLLASTEQLCQGSHRRVQGRIERGFAAWDASFVLLMVCCHRTFNQLQKALLGSRAARHTWTILRFLFLF